MKLEQKFAYVAEEVKKVEEWAANNSNSYWYNDFIYQITCKLRPIKQFAEENNIPFVVSAEAIAEKHYDDTDGYSEEESSSYYEEPESSEYEEEEYDESEYETEESNY